MYVLCLQFNQIFNTFALKPDLDQLMGNSESAHWPLQAGYPGQAIKNLNEYVSFFSHCLVNIQNYQGVEIIGVKSPVYITRFDVAYLKSCTEVSKWFGNVQTRAFLFGKIPPKSEQNCFNYYDEIEYTDKSIKSRWHCRAQFDLFFPEPADAPQIVKYSQQDGIQGYIGYNLFGASHEYISYRKDRREALSKIL